MNDRIQPEDFTDRVRRTAFAEGADAAFDVLVRSGWTVPSGQDGKCPPGYRIFALASWERRVLIRDSDGSLWALQTED